LACSNRKNHWQLGDANNPKNEIDDELRRNSTDISYESKVHGWFSAKFANKVERTPYFDLDQYAEENQVIQCFNKVVETTTKKHNKKALS
jgi:hypothetical protein